MLLVDLNGDLIPESEALIPAQSRAVAYGEGCFETLKLYHGRFLRLEAHLNRLKLGAELLQLKMDSISLESIRERIINVVQINDLQNKIARVRIQLGTTGKAGAGFGDKQEFFTLITAVEMSDEKPNPVRLITSSIRKIPTQSLDSRVKWNQYLTNMMALREAQSIGADDSLMLTINGIVSETAIANIFWVKDETCFTPSDDCDILPGVTREIVLDALKAESIPVCQGSFRCSELMDADCLFISNSGREILPVLSVDDKKFRTEHPVLSRIKKQYELIKRAELC